MNNPKIHYPKTKQIDNKETLFGVEINDKYRWLEDEHSPEVAAWVDEQIRCTESYLAGFPERQAIKERLMELYDFDKFSPLLYDVNGNLIYEVTEGLNNQPTIYIMEKDPAETCIHSSSKRRVLLDPNAQSADGSTSFSLCGESKDGKIMGVLSAESGSDWQTMHLMDMDTGERLGDVLHNIKFTHAAWYRNGFYYSGYEIPDDKRDLTSLNSSQTIFYHKLGDPQSEDQIIFKDEEHPLRYLSLDVTDDERHLVLTISEGTSGIEIRHRAADAPESKFKTIFEGFEHEYYFVGSREQNLYFLTNDGASNMKIVSYDTESGETAVVLGESDFFIDSARMAGGRILINCSQKAISRLKVLDLESGKLTDIALPGIGSVISTEINKSGRQAYYSFGSFLMPTHHYLLDLESGVSTPINTPSMNFDPSQYLTEQVFFPSKDGTEIPMFITRKRDMKLDGKNPGFIYGYGGFQISIMPSFGPSIIQMLERGFVYAVVNLRGGLELGENWHKAGMLHNKQNVFDDMIAGSEYLIARGYTSSDRLAIHGRSNGGLLAGAVMCQRPDLYAVSLPQVGVLDMIRFHKFTVGWGWMTEYGNPDAEEDFHNILKYSPLHNIREIKYPATLVLTADHDDRVVPAHSFKFGAQLQESADPWKPALIHITKGAGHGAGNAIKKVIDERTDVLTFMLMNFAK